MGQVNRISKTGMELIKSFEGLRRHSEALSGGGWIVGYGHTKSARQGVEVSEREAEYLLRYDLQDVESYVSLHVHAPLNQNEFDALVSFCWNIGKEAFASSDVLNYVNAGEMLAAAESFSAWRKARIAGRLIVLDALVRRRTAEKNLFLSHPSGPPSAPSKLVKPELDTAASVLALTDGALSIEAKLNAPEEDAAVVTPKLEPQTGFAALGAASLVGAVSDPEARIEDDIEEIEDAIVEEIDDTADTVENISETADEAVEEVEEFVSETKEDAIEAAEDVTEFADDLKDDTSDAIDDAISDIDETIEDLGQAGEETLEDLEQTTEETLEDLEETAEETIEDTEDALEDTAGLAFTAVSDEIDETLDEAKDAATELKDDIVDAADDLQDDVEDAFEDDIEDFDLDEAESEPDPDDDPNFTYFSEDDEDADLNDDLSRAMAAAAALSVGAAGASLTRRVERDDDEDDAEDITKEEIETSDKHVENSEETLLEDAHDWGELGESETETTTEEIADLETDSEDTHADALDASDEDVRDDKKDVQLTQADKDADTRRMLIDDISNPGMTLDEIEAMEMEEALNERSRKTKLANTLPFLFLSIVGLVLAMIGAFDWWNTVQAGSDAGDNGLHAGPFLTLIGGFALVFGLYFLVRNLTRKQKLKRFRFI